MFEEAKEKEEEEERFSALIFSQHHLLLVLLCSRLCWLLGNLCSCFCDTHCENLQYYYKYQPVVSVWEQGWQNIELIKTLVYTRKVNLSF